MLDFDRANFEFLEIHRCPEGADIGSKQLIFEFKDLISKITFCHFEAFIMVF